MKNKLLFLEDVYVKILTEGKKSNLVKNPLTSKEREEVRKRFGEVECSFAKNEKGEYFCYTHRYRSKFYKSIAEIPVREVKFVSSTS